jgi:hypothetical protein
MSKYKSSHKSSIQHKEKAMNKRQSVKPTYDSRTDGLQYTISTSVNGKAIGDYKEIADPFVNHKVRVSWKETLKGLVRGGVVVGVMVSGKNLRIEEDVMELDDNYLSLNSTRRDDFDKHIFSQIDEHITREMGEL